MILFRKFFDASCDLTTGFSLDDCLEGAAGLRTGYGARFGDIQSIQKDANNVITGITLKPGRKWYEYQFTRNTAGLVETIQQTVENGSVSFQPVLTVAFNKNNPAVRNEVSAMSKNKMVFIVEDQSDQFYLVGEKNGLITGGTRQSGVVATDRNGYNLTFTGEEPSLAKYLSQAAINAVKQSADSPGGSNAITFNTSVEFSSSQAGSVQSGVLANETFNSGQPELGLSIEFDSIVGAALPSIVTTVYANADLKLTATMPGEYTTKSFRLNTVNGSYNGQFLNGIINL